MENLVLYIAAFALVTTGLLGLLYSKAQTRLDILQAERNELQAQLNQYDRRVNEWRITVRTPQDTWVFRMWGDARFGHQAVAPLLKKYLTSKGASLNTCEFKYDEDTCQLIVECPLNVDMSFFMNE